MSRQDESSTRPRRSFLGKLALALALVLVVAFVSALALQPGSGSNISGPLYLCIVVPVFVAAAGFVAVAFQDSAKGYVVAMLLLAVLELAAHLLLGM